MGRVPSQVLTAVLIVDRNPMVIDGFLKYESKSVEIQWLRININLSVVLRYPLQSLPADGVVDLPSHRELVLRLRVLAH